MARPTDFKPKYTTMLIDYFSAAPYKKLKAGLEPSDFPSLAGFAIKIGVHRDTLHEWANKFNDDGSLAHPEFSDAYKRAKDFQENFILVNGSRGLLPTNFAIFTAINVLGFRNKAAGEADVVVNNNTFANLSDEELDKKIALHEAKRKPSE